MQLPKLSPTDWRAWAAMISITLGGVSFTLFAVWLVWILAFSDLWSPAVEASRLYYLGVGLMLLLAGTIAVLLSQGFAINQREISITKEGLTLKGGQAPETLHTPS